MGALGEVGETLRTSDGSPVPKHRHQQYGAGEDEATCKCSWIVEFFSWKKHREVRKLPCFSSALSKKKRGLKMRRLASGSGETGDKNTYEHMTMT